MKAIIALLLIATSVYSETFYIRYEVETGNKTAYATNFPFESYRVDPDGIRIYGMPDKSVVQRVGKTSIDGSTISNISELSDFVPMTVDEVRQSLKSDEVKTTENKYLLLCEALTGSKTKQSFEALSLILDQMFQSEDPSTSKQAIGLSVKLLALDAQLKRAAGPLWWDTVAWHPEITQLEMARRDRKLVESVRKPVK